MSDNEVAVKKIKKSKKSKKEVEEPVEEVEEEPIVKKSKKSKKEPEPEPEAEEEQAEEANGEADYEVNHDQVKGIIDQLSGIEEDLVKAFRSSASKAAKSIGNDASAALAAALALLAGN